MSRSTEVYLLDIVESCLRIGRYVGDSAFEAFVRDERTVDAVVRNLEVIGEAVKQLPMELRDQNPQVPWKRIAGLRDVLIHQYYGVDFEILWDIVRNLVPLVETEVSKLVAKPH